MAVHDAERFHPLSLEDWRSWLADHHATSRGVWLVTFKKATGQARIEYEHAVEEALCWGWIDSVSRGLDDQRGMLWYSPRKKDSGWSRSNKERLVRLEAEGRIQPAGRAVLDAAKADGSWTKLDDVENRTVPDDLAAEFARYPDAARWFAGFPAGERRRILEWIAQAKTAPTRQKRIDETARLAQDNVRANLWKKKETP
jgi:uncharacterized protein YdeI (YjbR/CyaY-like superfamily)